MLQLNGNDVAPGFRSRLNALSLRLEGMGHPAVGVASGKRSKALQEQIFRDRYRRQASGGGPYGDVRWWDGDGDGARERWVRVKAGGTVLPPGDSTHEDPPATGADLSWPYNNRYTAAHAALVAICEQYGIRWTGVNFGEDWHFDSIWDAYASFAAGEAQSIEEEDVNGEQDKRLRTIEERVNDLVAALLDGRKETGWGERAIDTIFLRTLDTNRRILPEGAPWDQLQLLVSLAASGRPADVDEAQLAELLAPMLVPLLSQHPTAVSDEQLAAFATAVADESDRRARARLGAA